MALEPGLDPWLFVSSVVVQHQMELQLFGELVIQPAQEFEKLLVAMARKALANDSAFQDFQSGKECRGPMADIIMSESAAATFLERQSWLSAIQGLNLALFIDTQDQALVWRIEVKAHHIRQFFQKTVIPRELESARSMGFE